MAGYRLYAPTDLAGNLIERLLFASADHHLRAFAREDLRDGFADTPAGSRNDGHFVFKNAHEFSISLLNQDFNRFPASLWRAQVIISKLNESSFSSSVRSYNRECRSFRLQLHPAFHIQKSWLICKQQSWSAAASGVW